MTAPWGAWLDDVFCLHPAPAGTVVALRGVTLAIAAGERVLLRGPSGSGKTSLLRILAGQQPASAGEVLVGGSPPSRAAVGWVDQRPGRQLRAELGVLDNIVLRLRIQGGPARAAQDAARALLDDLGLGALATARLGTLSGGQLA
jgi:ABC-type nitrate/sulfonate/bicarbonate transport system ATPase subunit